DRDREDLLRLLLADHVLVERRLDLARLRDARARRRGLLLSVFLGDDVVAELDALVADVDGRPRDELLHLPLALAAEGAGGVRVVAPPLHPRCPPPLLLTVGLGASPCWRTTRSISP